MNVKNLILCLSVLIACQSEKSFEKKEVLGKAQGTTYQVLYRGEEKSNLKPQIDSLLLEIDNSMSTWVENSTISKLNRGDSIEIDTIFKSVFQLSQLVHEKSSGLFDPGIAPLLEVWGFDYSKPKQMNAQTVDSLLAFSSLSFFELDDNLLRKKDSRAKLSFNAVAQGYSVDLMAAVVEENGIENYYVELGGEVKVRGRNFEGEWWRIGIDKPSGLNLERKLSAIVSLQNQAMVTSGNYRKFVEIEGQKYSHSVNPKTGYPVAHHLLSATVIAKNAGEADAYATACMVMGLEKAEAFIESLPKTEAIFIYDEKGEYQLKSTAGIAEQLESLEK